MRAVQRRYPASWGSNQCRAAAPFLSGTVRSLRLFYRMCSRYRLWFPTLPKEKRSRSSDVMTAEQMTDYGGQLWLLRVRIQRDRTTSIS